MALILCIETGTDICSVGIAENGELVSLRESDEGRDHARKVGVFVDEILKENRLDPDDLDAVAVGKGPGSYTGLRIGVSFAKGLCYGLRKPLVAVGSLDALCEVAREDYEAGILAVEDWERAVLIGNLTDCGCGSPGGLYAVVRRAGGAAHGGVGRGGRCGEFFHMAGERAFRDLRQRCGEVRRCVVGRRAGACRPLGARVGAAGADGFRRGRFRRSGLFRTLLSERFRGDDLAQEVVLKRRQKQTSDDRPTISLPVVGRHSKCSTNSSRMYFLATWRSSGAKIRASAAEFSM